MKMGGLKDLVTSPVNAEDADGSAMVQAIFDEMGRLAGPAFFGRDALSAQLATRLTSLADSDQRFLAVVGASGSGKSSVVRAGLIPVLRWQPPTSGWPIFVLTPTARPLENLAAALCEDSPPGSLARTLADEIGQECLAGPEGAAIVAP